VVVREERKKREGNRQEKRGKKGGKEEKERESGGRGIGKKKEGGGWIQGVRGAWVLRRVGPHTNNARST